jgi:molecular chaperone GrpE
MKSKSKKIDIPAEDVVVRENPNLDSLKLQQEITTLNDNWKRALADYQNLVKRVETEKRDLMRLVSTSIITKLLPTLDILEMAANHSQDEGVKMAVRQFQQVLSEEGLVEINPQPGDVFDHLLHECIEVVPGDQENAIAEAILKGYKIGDYIIRPSKVKVTKKDNVGT